MGRWDTVCDSGWFNTIPCCNALSQLSMCMVPWSMCTLHAIPDSSWQTRRVLMTVKLHPIKSKLNLSLTIAKLFYVSKHLSFQQFSMVVACCYSGWNLNTTKLPSAWWTGLGTSSGYVLKQNQSEIELTMLCVFIWLQNGSTKTNQTFVTIVNHFFPLLNFSTRTLDLWTACQLL